MDHDEWVQYDNDRQAVRASAVEDVRVHNGVLWNQVTGAMFIAVDIKPPGGKWVTADPRFYKRAEAERYADEIREQAG